MATRMITTRLALDGEQEYKRQLASVNSELRTQKTEMQLLEAQFKGQANTMEALTEKDRVLRKEIEQQEEKVKALAQAVVDSAAAYGDADKRTDGYRQSLNRAQKELIEMNRELEDTARYLEEASESADGTASSIDGFGREIKSAGNPLEDFGGSLDEFKQSLGKFKDMLVGGAVVKGVKELGDAVLDLEESTREYRRTMGTLEVSAEQAGYTAEETQEAYNRLYSVLGESQTTATTVANLQAIGLSQRDLMTLIDQTVGAWGSYGDSIPIDGLAEAINETIRAGEVTGTFADVLNWGSKEGETFGVTMRESTDANADWNKSVEDAKAAEDYFNLALQNCQTEAERADLILKTLSEQGLTEAGQSWRDVNEDIVAANDSQNRMEQAMGRLGEAIAPVANTIIDVGAGAIEYFAGMIEGAITLVQNFLTWWDKFLESDTSEVNKRRAAARGYTAKVDTSSYTTGPNDTSAWADGSHASGLERVPFDGYVAEVHKDEAILTAGEADWWRSMKAAPIAAPGVTTADLQAVTAAAVNAINLGQRQERIVIEAKWVVNGREFYADTIDDLRAVNRSNPEVTDDR